MEHSNLSSSSTHHHHQSGLHWSTTGYSPPPAPPSAWQNVAATTSLSRGQIKRPLSESDDCDDAYSEGSSKDHCSSPGNADSCQMLSRKKRRGVIEKKRRDRINMSLSELKRLVPSAFEKQGSAKLEKAEILQMTVDHLKMIHAKGLDSLAYDPHKYAMDYHGMGFRECVAEVARYLERIEGLDVQNPLRLRLTSHLQCCAAQRELASKQATAPTWSYPAAPQHYPPPPPPPTLPPSGDLTQQYDPPQNSQERLPTVTSSSSSILTPLSSSTLTHPYGHQYHHPPPPPPPPSVNAFHHHHQSYGQGSNLPPTSQGMKPYRPWGAELAY